MSKKSQVQIFETIAVLFVFFLLIIIGFTFYTKIAKSNLKSEQDEFSQLESIAIAQKVMFMPELQCSQDNIAKENCFDKLKLDSAKTIITSNEIYYYDLFEFSDISVFQIYPDYLKWEIYSRKTNDFRNNFTTNVPVSIYDPITKLRGFGILHIETLTK